jgi:outer membrane receptor protein involved in Fe transport
MRGSTGKRRHTALTTLLLASTMLAGVARAEADDTAEAGPIEEVVVTAQKRQENLQNVPASVQALGETKLDELNVTQFADYVKFLPSVTYQSTAPSQTSIYMRGVANGDAAFHSGPLPTVGVYLDEQPVTTIAGQLDVHIYDVARVESLMGPQGTLYGASSEAGTLRIITNPPDPTKFSAGYDLEVNQVDHGGIGYIGETYVNAPISDKAAIRIVGFDEHDAGYIDNVYGTRTFTTGLTVNNADRVKSDYNDVNTGGGRLALKIDLDDDWTVTPSIMGQQQDSNGVFGYDPSIGDLQVRHFFPEYSHDRWFQAALTVTGKIGDLDIVYSGGYFQRGLQTASDYSDYSYFYDQLYAKSYAGGFTNAAGQLINPSQELDSRFFFTKQSHELRVASPDDARLRFVAGLFIERQTEQILDDYVDPGLSPALSITGWPGTVYMNNEVRVDRDAAVFGQASYDVTDDLTVKGGLRVFDAHNTLYGFYGFGDPNPVGSDTNEGALCVTPHVPFHDAPCVDINQSVEEVNVTWLANVTYKFDSNRMVYATASTGFRPPGVNRLGTFPPYASDYLDNYEIGWKTSWDGNKIRWNGAVFDMIWDNMQYGYSGPNGITVIVNAPQAEIRGLESDLTWAATRQLTLSGSASLIDARLTANYCQGLVDGHTVTNCQPPDAPSGTQLPITPYVKANATARYAFPVTDDIDGFVQGSVIFSGGSAAALSLADRAALGRQPAYSEVDLSTGIAIDNTSIELFIKNALDSRGQIYRYAECATATCGVEPYVGVIQPLTVGLKFGQKF